jgi:predicted trehalose synthase
VAVGLELVGVLSEMKRPLAALDVLERMRPFTDGPTQRSAMLQREAALWSAQERWSRALDALQTASRIEPSRADLHYRAAEVLERMGSLHSALDEVRRGRALDTPNGAQAVSAWLNRLEAAQSPQ